MAFMEFTRILSENKTVKWPVNPNNTIYFQGSIRGVLSLFSL